ncbi:hypothetical protein [Ideonella sp. YS5]|uniref:hypothetical protein n=1 Tax=Ideonella sp. YS5 TaxID=3453714 RepID=UPI003EEDFA9B
MNRALISLAVVVAIALLLPACKEHSQAEPAAMKKADAKAYTGAAGEPKVYTATGWTAGDDASWQNQIRGRTQGQNEYVRISATHGSATAPDASPPAASAPAVAASEPAVAKAP